METNFYSDNHGLGLDFNNWYQIVGYGWDYNDGFNNDPLDGLTWTGSVENLIDCEGFNNIQKVAPEVRFDYGTWCGFTNFDYIIVPIWYIGTYRVYALTNSQTKLQLVGSIVFDGHTQSTDAGERRWYCSGSGTISSYSDPVENYVPEETNLVETITVDGVTYTYSEHGWHLQEIWTNNQTGDWVMTYNCRNPQVGWDAGMLIDDSGYGYNFRYYSIEAITYYPGVTPPEES